MGSRLGPRHLLWTHSLWLRDSVLNIMSDALAGVILFTLLACLSGEWIFLLCAFCAYMDHLEA